MFQTEQASMGIPNFTTFLHAANLETHTYYNFDSILIDAQSLLYIAIDNSLKENEKDLLKDVNRTVVYEIVKILNTVFSTKVQEEFVTIIISFDGEGVPMKWPTQQKRREKLAQGRDLYKVVLLGNNNISNNVNKYLQESLIKIKQLRLRNQPKRMRFVVSGSNVDGEGEHKLFQIAKHYKVKRPMIISEDNDVFILSYIHLSDFDYVQMKRKAHIYYNLNNILQNYLQYSSHVLIHASFLFGNDFLPPLISVNENNPNLIHDAMHQCNEDDDLPTILYRILSSLHEQKKIRYSRVMFTDIRLVKDYWKNCLWVLDYYRLKTFPQKYMYNTLYEQFDRNMMITALLDFDYSQETFLQARMEYEKCMTRPLAVKARRHVFHPDQWPHIERFFTNIKTDEEGYIFEINVSSKI